MGGGWPLKAVIGLLDLNLETDFLFPGRRWIDSKKPTGYAADFADSAVLAVLIRAPLRRQ